MVWTTDYNYNYELVNFLLQTSTFFFISMSSTQYLLKSYLVKKFNLSWRVGSISKSSSSAKTDWIFERPRPTIEHIAPLFTYILGSSECQSFCRVSSNIHSSEKLGKMYILEALTQICNVSSKTKIKFVCLFLNRLKFSLHYFNYIFLRHVYRFPNPQ